MADGQGVEGGTFEDLLYNLTEEEQRELSTALMATWDRANAFQYASDQRVSQLK